MSSAARAETGSASSQVLSAAQMLSGDSNRLKIEVAKFLDFGFAPPRGCKKTMVIAAACRRRPLR
jgi:hypothetical protein